MSSTFHRIYCKDKSKVNKQGEPVLASFKVSDDYNVSLEEDRVELIKMIKEEVKGSNPLILIDTVKLNELRA